MHVHNCHRKINIVFTISKRAILSLLIYPEIFHFISIQLKIPISYINYATVNTFIKSQGCVFSKAADLDILNRVQFFKGVRLEGDPHLLCAAHLNNPGTGPCWLTDPCNMHARNTSNIQHLSNFISCVSSMSAPLP